MGVKEAITLRVKEKGRAGRTPRMDKHAHHLTCQIHQGVRHSGAVFLRLAGNGHCMDTSRGNLPVRVGARSLEHCAAERFPHTLCLKGTVEE